MKYKYLKCGAVYGLIWVKYLINSISSHILFHYKKENIHIVKAGIDIVEGSD